MLQIKYVFKESHHVKEFSTTDPENELSFKEFLRKKLSSNYKTFYIQPNTYFDGNAYCGCLYKKHIKYAEYSSVPRGKLVTYDYCPACGEKLLNYFELESCD